MKIGYARVSTKDQTVLMQVDALKKAGCNQVYEEIASGAKTARPVLVGLCSVGYQYVIEMIPLINLF